MKKFTLLNICFSLTFLSVLGYQTAQAQDFAMTTGNVVHKDASRTAIQVVMEPPTDDVKKAWEDFMKDKYDIKMKGNGWFSNKDVLFAEEVTISPISTKSLNFYTRIVEKGDNTELSTFASLGYDIYLNEKDYLKEFIQLQQLTKDFVDEYLPNYYLAIVEETQSKLNDFEKNRGKLQDNISDNNKKIEKLSEENEKMTTELNTTIESVNNTGLTLTDQKEKLKNIKFKLSQQSLIDKE